MIVKTKFFGEIDVPNEKIIKLEGGLFGFEKLQKYVLVPHEKDNMFKWLQSMEDPTVCFLVVEPVLFMFNYSLEISDETVEKIQLKDSQDAVIYSLVVIPEDPMRISANLCGPIVINTVNRCGMQVVSTNPEHLVKHYIIEELKKNAHQLMSNVSAAFGTPVLNVEEKTEDAEKKNSIFSSDVNENNQKMSAYMV
ncbi:MAG: flagellar assembly protein FliW [Candidatus Wallbacteria bacterium]